MSIHISRGNTPIYNVTPPFVIFGSTTSNVGEKHYAEDNIKETTISIFILVLHRVKVKGKKCAITQKSKPRFHQGYYQLSAN